MQCIICENKAEVGHKPYCAKCHGKLVNRVFNDGINTTPNDQAARLVRRARQLADKAANELQKSVLLIFKGRK